MARAALYSSQRSTSRSTGGQRSVARSTSRGYSYGSNGSAAYQRQAAPARSPQQPQRRPMRVIPGKGASTKRQQGISQGMARGFKLALTFALAFAVVCCVSVWMSVSTVQALQNTSNIQTQIEEARAAGNDLEIEHSVLANPTRIQKQAKELGMSAPKTTEQITVAIAPSTKMFRNGGIDIKSTVKSIQESAAAGK